MKKKLLFGLAATTLGMFALASCGDTTPSGQATLNTMSMFGGKDAHAKAYSQFVKEFGEENNVQVNDNSAASSETWKTSVLSTFYTGNQPDVLFYFTGRPAEAITDNGYVVSIKDIRKEYPDYAKNIKDDILDPYAVTLKGFVEGIFVNTELFTGDLASYASKDKWSWTEFMEVCEKLKDKGITPMAMPGKEEPHYWIEHLILQMAGKDTFGNIPTEDEFKAATGNGNTDADKWIKALQLFKTLDGKGYFGEHAKDGQNLENITAFQQGRTAMYLNGSWFQGQIDGKSAADQDHVKMIPFPAIPTDMGGANKTYMESGFTSGFFITKKAWDNPAKRDLAVKFVEKMTSAESIKRFCKDAGGVPADSSVVLDGLTPLAQSMNTMLARTDGATLPLGDAAAPNSFKLLVEGASSFFGGDANKIKSVLEKFAAAQK